MAGNQVSGEGLSANLAGMSKSQLYDIMSQMKALIEQNQQQARQILVQNPVLTRALFQAQIMLGMVQPPQAVPSVQPAIPQNPQPTLPIPQSTIQAAPLPQGQVGVQDQKRKQQQSQPVMPVPSVSVSPPNFSSQTLAPHSLQSAQQPKVHGGLQSAPIQQQQTSQAPIMTSLPHHSSSQQPSHLLQPPMPSTSSQLQQPMQASGIPHMQLQPPQLPQSRPQMPSFPYQHHTQPNLGFQHQGAPQFHHSQPMFHPGSVPPVNAGPPFMQGQPPLRGQLPPQSLYQMGSGAHIGTDYNQAGSSLQADRSGWTPENRTAGAQLPGPPPFPGQMGGPGNQPPRPPHQQLAPEAEKALLEKVLSLTPEEISVLPPDQRNQVFQLQQMMRQ